MTAGQAFHWFDAEAARKEFARILRPDGRALLVRNVAQFEASPFMRAYRAVRDSVPGRDDGDRGRRIGDSSAVGSEADSAAPGATRSRQHATKRAQQILFADNWESREFANRQVLDREGLLGRVLSESGSPLPDDPRYDAMVELLMQAFDRHADSGLVEIVYTAETYLGKVSANL